MIILFIILHVINYVLFDIEVFDLHRYEVLNKLEEETHHHDYHHEDNYQSLIEEEEEEEMITLAAEDVDNFEEETTTTTTNIEQQKTVTKHEIEIRVRDAMDADEGGGSEASMSSRQPSGLNGVRSLIVQPTMSSPLPGNVYALRRPVMGEVLSKRIQGVPPACLG